MSIKPIVWSGVGADITNLNSSSSPIVVGYNLSGFLGTNATPIALDTAEYTQFFYDFAKQAINKNGIFTNLAPDTSRNDTRSDNDGFLRSYLDKGYAYVDYKIGDKDTLLQRPNLVSSFVEGYNQFNELFLKSQKVKVDYSQNNNSNTFILGTASNLDLQMGNGNNIIIASPVMNVFLKTFNDYGEPTFTTAGNTKEYTNIFYPASQGALHSNDLKLGDGNNLVYFDGSFKSVKTGDGNNVFTPSFGAFNWATNDPQGANSDSLILPNQQTLISPIPLITNASDNSYSQDDLYTFVRNTNRDDGNQNSFQVYLGKDPSLKNNLDNTIGGLRLTAGDGTDTFYGMDPSFYDSIRTGRTGAERVVFDQPKDANNKRLSLQNYETVEMLGGGGNNIFYLGNPTHVSADGSQYNGRYSYLLSVGHNQFGSDRSRSELMWGEASSAVNTVNVNLSANIETYRLSSTSFDQEKGGSVNVYNAIKTGNGLASATNKYLDKVQNLAKEGGAVLKKLIPYADFAFSAVSAVTDTVQLISNIVSIKADPEPIKLAEEQIRQPLGSWKQAVGINDWNPNLALNISVDPTFTTAGTDLRWNNLKFNIAPPGSSSEFQQGVVITYQQGSDTPKTLFHLDGFGTSAGGRPTNYGYYSYDFTMGKNRLITETDLAFMGTIAYGVKGIDPIRDYEATNGFVFSSSNSAVKSAYGNSSYSFYWNDRGFIPGTKNAESNTERWLQDARDKASSLTIQFDSRSFGWFWQPAYTSTADYEISKDPSDLTLDTKASKLWVELKNGQWIPYTFTDLETKPMAFSYALRAKTFYQINSGDEALKPFNQITSEKLSDSLKLVDQYFSDLSQLDTNKGKKTLDSVQQITFAKEGKFGALGEDGLYVYSIHETLEKGTSKIVKGFVQKFNGYAQYITSSIISSDEYYKAEVDDQVDINLDGIIGRPSVKIVQDSNALVGSQAQEFRVLSSTSSSKFIEDLYGASLNRKVDAEGFKAWSSALANGQLTKAEVMVGVLSSDEFFNIQATRQEFIDDLYEQFFMREPDAAGLKAWLHALDNGMSHKDIVQGFSNSNEYKNLIGLTGVSFPQSGVL